MTARRNTCDSCGTPNLDPGSGLCGGCADDEHNQAADPWVLTAEQATDLEVRRATSRAALAAIDDRPPW